MNRGFRILGSGSKGNAALVWSGESRVLIDAGFSPDELSERLKRACELDWEGVDALLLTHTHGDHLKKRCLQMCAERRVRFWCHERHAEELANGRCFRKLRLAGGLRLYGSRRAFSPAPGIQVKALPVSHDRPPTFAFRFELAAGNGDGNKQNLDERSGKDTPPTSPASPVSPASPARLAYAADLGEWTSQLAAALSGVDLLALEFNHDERMEEHSGRPWCLVERVLGPHGHLSNRQAAALLERLLRDGNGPRSLVQLHLSEECNTPKLAFQAAQTAAAAVNAPLNIFSSRQGAPGRSHHLSPPRTVMAAGRPQ